MLAADATPLGRGGSEAGEKCPGFLRPSRVVQRMVPGALLVGQFGIAEFDRPLFDVETELGMVKRQFMGARFDSFGRRIHRQYRRSATPRAFAAILRLLPPRRPAVAGHSDFCTAAVIRDK
jgi:hypothetical protein